MQFKHPELLWALFLLLIPIFIHLFQLRRFKKTPFTNVKFLKKVVSKSRKSSTLKKWLLLFTRLFLLAALIVAFAQPFFAKNEALKQRETVIYLDNSFSMQAKTDDLTLLENAKQELLEHIPENSKFSLFTNDGVFEGVTLKEIQNDLLAIPFTQKQLNLSEIHLKANSLLSNEENTIRDVIFISDFQQRMAPLPTDTVASFNSYAIPLFATDNKNIAIDTAYLSTNNAANLELSVELSSSDTDDNIPVSLFNGNKLIAKTSASFDTGKKTKVLFSLPSKETINGKITINDKHLFYDNALYFTINKKKKIKVMAIGETDTDFLKRIYTNDEFDFSTFSLNSVNYADIEKQNLIVLNELNTIPNSLQATLKTFTRNGGNLIIIPPENIDIPIYNEFLEPYFSTEFVQKTTVEKNISGIVFDHPLFENVFDKKVTNFQYPTVNQSYRIKTTAPKALSFQDGQPFLLGVDGIYIFTAPIQNNNSNFQSSPLIVPTFYNMGINSLRLSQLYAQIGPNTAVDIPVTLSKDQILKISKTDHEFIPRQQSAANKVSLFFDKNTVQEGIYIIKNGENLLANISFNHNRQESELTYLNMNAAENQRDSIASLFQEIQNEQNVDELWKWFVILALAFIGIEILLQKFLQ
ncbi:BatA domain-containing protein [Costertonia aggregata]|uniref:BatA domain-containing protein n=1 Tax=Costertonia aggregata TaxID=343403 RepID=A0A7H9AUF0_9FLAO|nr:BatA domain-containing protein [Costertonia aggregata]QLG47108.1 BatA domain-containing protein [Costertonia aggregata]